MSSQIQVRKMHYAQVRLMLDYLGFPIKEQEKSTKRIKDQLQIFKETDRAGFDMAYDSIILHKSGGTSENVIPLSEASKLIHDHINAMQSSALNSVEVACQQKIKKREEEMASYQKNFVATVADRFEKAVERESKKFQTIAVKIGNRKANKIKGVVPEVFPRLIQLAQARKNILVVGPSGCGKTHVASQMADAMNLKYGSQSCSAGVSESAFSGWLMPTGNNGRFDHVMSVFLDIYENGGIFLFDEFDASDANVAVFLNQALAQDHFFLPQRYKNQIVKKHKDFIAVAAANTFGGGADGMYHGRIALDAATLDRFRIGTVYMGYSAQVEEKIVDADILEWGRSIRNKIDQHRMKKIMSTRVLIEASQMKKEFDWTINDIEQGYFADWSREEKSVCGFQLRGEV